MLHVEIKITSASAECVPHQVYVIFNIENVMLELQSMAFVSAILTTKKCDQNYSRWICPDIKISLRMHVMLIRICIAKRAPP